jgi:hypothetical protein
MKYPISPISVVCALLMFLPAGAQPQPSLSGLRPVIIHLKAAHDAGNPDPNTLFSHFEVIDERPDTSRIGVHTNSTGFGRPHDRQLVFARPAAQEIAGYLNRHFTRARGSYTALVVLRTLWLSDANYIREDMVRDPDKRFEKTHIRLKAEIYAIRDSRYIPVLRLDTLQASIKMRYYSTLTPYSDWDDDLSALLDELVDSCSRVTAQKADQVTAQKTGQDRQIDLAAIRQFNASRFDAPIGNTPALIRGVYASFEEFRNNAPSIQDFEIKMDNNARLLYIREAGKTYYSHDAWGYCDGKDIYVMRDGILCPAWKEGKAFYFYNDTRKPRNTGNDYYNPAPGVISPANSAMIGPSAGNLSPAAGALMDSTLVGSLIGRNNYYKQRCIYSIDMDTGDVY